MSTVTKREGIEIRIGDVPLVTKLDALGAAIAAVREAHGDVIGDKCWAAMNKAQESIAEAILTANNRELIELPPAKRRLRVT